MTGSESSRGPVGRTWIVLAVLPILLATLPPQPDWPRSHTQFVSSLVPVSRGGWFDVAQNIALYAPLGLILAARGQTVLRACGAAALLSLITEFLQYVIPGRSPALRDIIVNTLGAFAGYLAWWTALGRIAGSAVAQAELWGARARRPDRRLASLLCLLWAFAFATVIAVTALLLAPAPPAHGYWVASPYIDLGPGPIYIGSDGTPEGSFRGLIDEVRIFNRARPAETIRQDMLRRADAPALSAQGLVAAFSFDADEGSLVRDDADPGRSAIAHGATWVPAGRVGGALSFDGGESQVVVPHRASLDLREGMTLEAWVRPGPGRGREAAIISRAGSAYYLAESSSEGPFYAAGGGRFGGVPRHATLPDPIEPEQWTHLATTFDGQVLRMYKDGTLAATQVHWSPHRPESAVMNGIALNAGRVRASQALRAGLRSDVEIDVAVRCGPLAAQTGSVFLVEGLQDSEVFALDAAAAELLIRSWTWADRLNLTSPPTRVADAFRGCAPGATVNFGVKGRLQDPTVTRDEQPMGAITAGMGSAWAFLWHAELAPIWAQIGLTCIWLACLSAPLGYWARPTRWSAAAFLFVTLACLTVPRVLHVRSLSGSELAALLAGLALGAVYGRAAIIRLRP